MSNRYVRKVLWFFGWLVCLPVLGWGISTGQIAVVATVSVAFFVSLYFSLQCVVCAHCANSLRVVGQQLNNCPKCGTPYDPPA